MPFIFRYKEFVIRFWYSFEEGRRHVHAVSDDANVKIWLEPEISDAFVNRAHQRINAHRTAAGGEEK